MGVTVTYPNTLVNGQTADASQVMANFTALQTVLSTSVAESGSNSSITALTGLTTPLALSMGGTASNISSFGFRGFLAGLGLTYASATTLTVGAGMAWPDVGAGNSFITLAAGVTLNFANTAVANGLDAGAIAASKTYHIFVISGTAGTASLASLSLTPALPTGYSSYRRIGSVLTNGSAQIIQFVQFGDDFLYTTPITDGNPFSITSATPVLFTLSVPTGVKVWAQIAGYVSGGGYITWDSPDTTYTTATQLLGNAGETGASFTPFFSLSVRTNTSGQIRGAQSFGGTESVYTTTRGWTDTRGRTA